MIHAQQKGYSPAEILRGLCDAVARNFKSSVVKGRPVEAPVALIGAVSQNAGVVRALREAFGLDEEQLFVPAAVRLVRRHRRGDAGGRGAAQALHSATSTACASTMSEERVQDTQAALHGERGAAARPRAGLRAAAERSSRFPAYLGIDIGSVSTNVVVIDEFGTVIHDVYLRTAGRPIEAVQQGLAEVERIWGSAAEDPRRGHHGQRARADRGVRGRRRGQRRDHRAQDGRASTSAARWAASRWTRSSRSAGRIRSSSRSRTAWWWISR